MIHNKNGFPGLLLTGNLLNYCDLRIHKRVEACSSHGQVFNTIHCKS